MVAVRVILVRVLTGPLGLLLTGVSLASLVALFIKNQREIMSKTGRFRELIARTRDSFEEAPDRLSPEPSRRARAQHDGRWPAASLPARLR